LEAMPRATSATATWRSGERGRRGGVGGG